MGKPHWIRAFYNFQVAQLVVLVLVFCSDLVALRRCESWSLTLQAQVRPNMPLYQISKKGLCATTRFDYILGFLLDFGSNAYFAAMTVDLCRKLEDAPAYLIRFFGGDLLE